MAIEAALDTAHHLIAKNEWRLPKDDTDTFRVLGEVGFVAHEFVPTLEKMAKFRNRLVHLYWDVDWVRGSGQKILAAFYNGPQVLRPPTSRRPLSLRVPF